MLRISPLLRQSGAIAYRFNPARLLGGNNGYEIERYGQKRVRIMAGHALILVPIAAGSTAPILLSKQIQVSVRMPWRYAESNRAFAGDCGGAAAG